MSLEKVLNAGSVAIVGASKNETKRGFQAIRTLLSEKYAGKIYPVNPKEKSIQGLPCHAKVSDISGPVDLVLITTPAQTIPAILEDCGAKGVHGAVIIAGGFGELGDEGRKLQDEVAQTARKHHIRLIGPNTSGMMNLKANLNLVGMRDAPKGDIALLTQSGNMALTLITEAKTNSQKGFSYYVGVGNEADINFHEYLAHFRNDTDTRAILMYVEGMRDGRSFLTEAHQTTRQKPIVLLKSGRSATGQRSAGSHTGALAGMAEVAKGAFTRAGIIVLEHSDELFPVAETLSSLPSIKNNAVAILADGGGHATIASDLLTDMGVNIPILSEETQEKLKKILPFAASVPNPVDVAGGGDADPAIFAECVRIILEDPVVGGLLMVGLFGGYGIRFAESLAVIEEGAARQMGKLVGKINKPIIMHSLFNSARPPALDILRSFGIPVYDSVDIACKSISALAQYGAYLNSPHTDVDLTLHWGSRATPQGSKIIRAARKEHRDALLEHEARELLVEHDLPVFVSPPARTADEAVAAAEKIAGSAAMKIVSPDILHKSDAGGVRLDLTTAEEVRGAFEDIRANAKNYNASADIRGVIVTPMAEAGVEIIVGTKIDDQFGPIIMFGLGGVLVEVLKDVSFRVLPLTPEGAGEMMSEIKASAILDGVRGNPPVDKEAIKKLLVKVSEIIESYPEIREMDLNPVIVHEKGLSIVDARIILNP
jgi:acetyltransferase